MICVEFVYGGKEIKIKNVSDEILEIKLIVQLHFFICNHIKGAHILTIIKRIIIMYTYICFIVIKYQIFICTKTYIIMYIYIYIYRHVLIIFYINEL